MSTTVIDTAVIGAGAAGLMVAAHLAERGVDFELYDEHARVGDAWRERYRSLRLFTPRPFLSLPGLPIEIGRFRYPTGAQLADYLERYAMHFRLPVHQITVEAVMAVPSAVTGRPASTRSMRPTWTTPARARSFSELRTSITPCPAFWALTARPFSVSIVVLRRRRMKMAVMRLPRGRSMSIRQLHSLDYRGAEQLADGPVLVVGAANSGPDVALEAAAAGHAVTLAGRHPGHVPIDIDRPLGNLMTAIFIRRLRNTTIDTEKGRAARAEGAGHGVMLVRNSLKDLARAGVVQVGRIEGVEAGRPVTADGTAIDAATVVWCTGSRPELHWIDVDGVVDVHGLPIEVRGVASGCRGLGFVGMPFQYSVASETLMGMDRDVTGGRCGAPSGLR